MAIHTAQHLLSAVLDTYNLPTLSWSMTQHPSLDCPYIELPRGLTWKEVQDVEDRCNELIGSDVGVWVETSMQSEEGVDGEGDRESRGIPKDYEGVSQSPCVNIPRLICPATTAVLAVFVSASLIPTQQEHG